ncbi:MAG TPA: hypothetical protein VKU41_25830, partial [Polyangiaceae bacterium]|nr:hypothetical protein [Polyangiaceae bacterium]
MMRGLGLARLAFPALAATLAGCHSLRSGTSADAGPDGAIDASEARATFAPEAGPPDDAIPQTSSDELTARARHLLDAIAKDEGELAVDILFPRDGWNATHEAEDPGKDWERHVAAPFRHAVHALSRRHRDLERAQFVGLELGHSVVQVSLRRHGW